MAYNQKIANRISKIVGDWDHLETKRMFGGIAHMLQGNMVCGIHKDSMILRLGEKEAAKALQKPHVSVFDITGKPMKGWVMVAEEGMETEEELLAWLKLARGFVQTLPAK